MFRSCPVVQYERNGAVHSIYKRITPIPEDFNAYKMFTHTWQNTPANNMGVDFEIYSSLDDLTKGENQWVYCNYNDPDVGYPRDCGAQGWVANQWFSMPGDRFNARGITNGAGFKLFNKCPIDVAHHQDILGGGWRLVRRVQAGNAWHPSTDQLMGTDVYGSYVNDPTADATFSIAFDVNRVSEFLFATGDGQKWLVASKDSVVGGFYANELRPIIASSASATASSARWYRRQGVREDPWISLSDHHPAIGAGEILYGGASFGSTHASAILPHHNGANVFVRFQPGARRMLKVGRLISNEGALFYNHGHEEEIY